MTELSPKAQVLVRAARDTLRASDADRERIRGALESRLGETTQPADGPAGAAPAVAPRALWPWVSAGLVGVALVGGLLAVTLRSSPDTANTPPVASSPNVASPPASSAPSSEPSQLEAPAELEAPVETEPAAPAPPAASAPRASASAPDRLAEEVALVGKAASDLRAGRAADALRALNEHQAEFPKGRLTQERRAAKAEALCGLGRFAEAKAELSRLPAASPHAVRARERCQRRSSDFR